MKREREKDILEGERVSVREREVFWWWGKVEREKGKIDISVGSHKRQGESGFMNLFISARVFFSLNLTVFILFEIQLKNSQS